MATVYPVLITIPDGFEGLSDEQANRANAGLYALTALLKRMLPFVGYEGTVAFGGLDHTVVLQIQRPVSKDASN